MHNTDISRILAAQMEFFAAGGTRTAEFRKKALSSLKKAIINHEGRIIEALKADLHKPPMESYMAEIGVILDEINLAQKKLKKWMRAEKAGATFLVLPSKSRIVKEPFGTVLIIGPWNYPFQLTLAPLVAAIAAGNCCIVKPSELAAESSGLIAAILREAFDEKFVAVAEGGAEVSSSLLDQPFGKIFFTGSPNIGKIVMEKAARHLTPVTLELGGKSPCIVDRNIPFDIAAKRILWGKFLNAGQTCVAPDYILVHKEAKEALYESLKKFLNAFYRETPEKSPDLARIVNRKHFDRLSKYMENGKIIIGGTKDEASLMIAPTVMEITDMTAPVMQEEIFGPILPVMEYSEPEDIIRMIGFHPDPLAFYIFSRDQKLIDGLIDSVPFGGGCINDTVSHITNHNLPFGGRGTSGVGAYHGKFGFETFTHRKSVLKRGFAFDLAMKYPPYGKNHLYIKKILVK
jgi:aldehyde dehydrogenase (NAD+)